jgi:hypothetical protein
MQNFHQSTQDHDILNSDRSLKGEKFSIGPFCENEKYEYGGQLKFEIHILFYGDDS